LSLMSLREPEGLPVLLALQEDQHDFVRYMACVYLEKSKADPELQAIRKAKAFVRGKGKNEKWHGSCIESSRSPREEWS
jgi:hypothetical protein